MANVPLQTEVAVERHARLPEMQSMFIDGRYF